MSVAGTRSLSSLTRACGGVYGGVCSEASRAAALAAAVLLAGATGARAQDATVQTPPETATETAAETPAVQTVPVAPVSVQAREIQALDLWSASARDTGLPSTLWRGAGARTVDAVLSELPGKPLTPAFADLARRLLATGGAAPDGAGDDATLAGRRARALVALGDPVGAEAILSRTPRVAESEALTRARAEAALALGRADVACEAERRLQENRGGAAPLQLRALCQALDGQTAASQVTADLWRGQGGRDAAFERLLTAANVGAAPGAPDARDPLTYALSRKLNLDLAPALAAAAPSVLVGLAADESAPRALRLEAAARALRSGAMSASAVAAVYAPPATPAAGEAVPPPPPTLAEATALPGARAEAALYGLAVSGTDLALREEATLALLRRARAGEFRGLARLAAPAIASLVQAGAEPKEPLLLATASAAAGDAETAALLRGRIEQGGAVTPLVLAQLDALIALAGDRPAGPVLDRLIELAGTGDARAKAAARDAAILLAAAGAPMSPDARLEFARLDGAAPRASFNRLTALQAAADAGAAGETGLYAVSIALQQPQPTAADRAAAVRALSKAGLGADARAIAIEGLLALSGR